MSIPADRGGELAGRDRLAHQRLVRGLVGALFLRELLGPTCRAKELEELPPKSRSWPLDPRLGRLVLKEIPRVERRRLDARFAVAAQERGVGRLLEPYSIGDDSSRREERDPTLAERQRIGVPERLAGEVRRLAQVCAPGVTIELGPEHVDHVVAGESELPRERQEKHELARPSGGPHLRGELHTVHRSTERAEHRELDPGA